MRAVFICKLIGDIMSDSDFEKKYDSEENEEAQDTNREDTALNPDECRMLICPQCEIHKEAEEIRLRALAEMENFKKRLQKEKNEQMSYAAESVLADLLPSLDNLDLAIQYGNKDEACQNTLMGVEMTRKLLIDAIKKHGLETIAQVGEAFDPELHEALAQEESDSVPPGHIISVMQKGYMLRGRLLRSAKVSVSKNPSTGTGFTTTV